MRVDLVHKVSSVYENGVSYGQSQVSTVGAAYTEGGFAPVLGQSTGYSQSQTQLSWRLRPPEEPQGVTFVFAMITCILVVGGTGLLFVSPIIGLIVLALGILALWGIISAIREGPRAYQAFLRQGASWSRLFYCARCDGAFIPGESSLVPSDQVWNWIHQG
jgi:hypothetical protein